MIKRARTSKDATNELLVVSAAHGGGKTHFVRVVQSETNTATNVRTLTIHAHPRDAQIAVSLKFGFGRPIFKNLCLRFLVVSVVEAIGCDESVCRALMMGIYTLK